MIQVLSQRTTYRLYGFSLHTQSLPITTGSGQTNTTILQFLSITRKLQNDRFDLCKSHPLSSKYSYNHSVGLMQPCSQSQI